MDMLWILGLGGKWGYYAVYYSGVLVEGLTVLPDLRVCKL